MKKLSLTTQISLSIILFFIVVSASGVYYYYSQTSGLTKTLETIEKKYLVKEENQKNYSDALTELETLKEQNWSYIARSSRLYYRLAQCYYMVGQYDQAIEHAQQSKCTLPSIYRHNHLVLADAYCTKKDYGQAIVALDKIKNYKNLDSYSKGEALCKKIEIYGEQGDVTNCKEYTEEFIKHYSEHNKLNTVVNIYNKHNKA